MKVVIIISALPIFQGYKDNEIQLSVLNFYI